MDDSMSISKKKRFEVFKRDDFTCRYCGRKPPQTTLEVDHIVPKCKGGKEEIFNYITSCFDCNRGKAGNELNDKIARPDIDKINKELKEQLEYLKIYYDCQDELIGIKERYLYLVIKHWKKHASSYISPQMKSSINNFLQDFSVEEICNAIDIACNKVYGWVSRFKYMCGVLHNRRKNGQSAERKGIYSNS